MPPRKKQAQQAPLDQAFYRRSAVEVAPDLLGRWLFRQSEAELTAGRIVEVEAYLGGDDPASHAYRGPSRRNATMFGPPGRAYVYTIHTRFCINAVTGTEGVASAVLIRALEPQLGLPTMAARRGVEKTLDIARGPGRLCQAMAIDRDWDGWDLTLGEQLWIAEGEAVDAADVFISPRIGISTAQDWPLRFVLRGSPFASGTRKLRGWLE